MNKPDFDAVNLYLKQRIATLKKSIQSDLDQYEKATEPVEDPASDAMIEANMKRLRMLMDERRILVKQWNEGKEAQKTE
jgi:hypothetical protein